MIRYFKTGRLSFLLILVGIIYACLFYSTYRNERENFMLDFMTGYSSRNNQFYEVYTVTIIPKKELHFPDSIVNFMNNSTVGTALLKIKASVPINASQPFSIYTDKTFMGIFSFIILAIFLFIPFHFYKLIKSLMKEIIFDKSNIKRIRYIGIAFLILFLATEFHNYLSYKINIALFNFNEYEIVKGNIELIWLLLGIVVLLIAEIIVRGKALKEEQELTI